MKKLISILVAFAMLTAAVFAQEGSWSVGSSGSIGVGIDIKPMEDEGGHATNETTGYDWRGSGDMRGNVDVSYNQGGLSTGFGINQEGIGLNLSFSGENFQFEASQDLLYLFKKIDASNQYDMKLDKEVARDKLWGNYTFQVLNGIKLELAAARDGQQTWNATDILGDTFTHTQWSGNQIWGDKASDGWNLGTSNYLKLDASPMDGLNLGFIIPDVFSWDATHDFLTGSLQYTVFGAKFATGPVGVGLQFALRGRQPEYFNDKGEVTNKIDDLKSGLYFGLSYSINDQMSAGAEFRSMFGGGQVQNSDNKPVDNTAIRFGASFGYNDGPLSASIKIKYFDDDTVNDHGQEFKINPFLAYTLVDGYLRAKIEVELTFKDTIEKYDDQSKPVWASVIDYSIKPAIIFNFLGTGVGDDPASTGIIIAYYAEGPTGYFEPYKGRNDVNRFEIMFSWGF